MKLSEEERKKLVRDPGLSWSKWARFVLLRYWYVFFSLLIDLGIPVQYLENYELVGSRFSYYEFLASLISIPVLMYIEIFLYRKLFLNFE